MKNKDLEAYLRVFAYGCTVLNDCIYIPLINKAIRLRHVIDIQ